jgi:hypothetical protein
MHMNRLRLARLETIEAQKKLPPPKQVHFASALTGFGWNYEVVAHRFFRRCA